MSPAFVFRVQVAGVVTSMLRGLSRARTKGSRAETAAARNEARILNVVDGYLVEDDFV